MPRSILSFTAIAAAVACSSCAPVEEEVAAATAGLSTERQCFFVSQINGYGEAPDGPRGSERLYIDTGPNDRWLFEAFGSCPELDWSQRIALDTQALSSVCTGSTATVLVPATPSGRLDRCPVRLLGKVAQP